MNETADKVAARPEKPLRIVVALEVVVALLPWLWIVAQDHLRGLAATCAYAIYDGARSSFLLIPSDPGTILTTLGALARVVLLLAPLVHALKHRPRHRLAWTPLLALIWVFVFGISVPAFSSVWMWLLLVATAGAGWFFAVRPKLFALAFLPWLVALEPTLGHSPLGDMYWSTNRLLERCASNDGVRAVDMRPEYAVARYFGVTPISPNLVLVTGERRSFWVRRDADGTVHLGEPLSFKGNMWQGCVRDGTAWITRRDFIVEAPIPREGEPTPEAKRHRVLGPQELGPELDYVDTICPANRSSVYCSQLIRGGFLDYDATTDTTRWHKVIPGLNLQLVERSDGMLVGITTGRLVVFDPRTDVVLQEQPAGTVAMGIDVCRKDGSIAVTDFVGRVRLFDMLPNGNYVFKRAGFSPAARRVSFSPDCSKLAVTSGNDRNLFILNRADMSTERTYSLGPGLRDIVYLDERWVAAADACVVNFVDTTR